MFVYGNMPTLVGMFIVIFVSAWCGYVYLPGRQALEFVAKISIKVLSPVSTLNDLEQIVLKRFNCILMFYCTQTIVH